MSIGAIFALFLISAPNLAFADESVKDGLLTKYSSDGQYLIEMRWSPPGEIKPNIDYFIEFEIKDGQTQKNLLENSFNLETTQKTKLLNNYVKEFDSNIFAKKFLFTDSGIINFVLSDINNSDQSVKFSMKLDSTQNSIMDDNGFTSKKRTDGKPIIFACGFEKNVKTLQDCFKTQTYENYPWFGKVNFLIYAPGWNEDSDKVESIGSTSEFPINIHSRSDTGSTTDLGPCNDGFVETGEDTGLFVARVKLNGHDHDLNGNGVLDTKIGGTKCSNSAIDEYGKIETGRKGAVTVSWQYQNDPDKVVTRSIEYNWNLGKINFEKDLYKTNDKIEFTFMDKDLYKIDEDKADVFFKVWSDSDQSGFEIVPGENYKFKNTFDFLVNSDKKVAESLFVADGDTVYVKYEDCTLPAGKNSLGLPNNPNDCVNVIAKTVVLRD